MKLFNKENFDSLVVKNWTNFISYKDLFKVIKEQSLGLINSMSTIKVNTSPSINSRIIMTRFEYIKNNIVIWFDFHVTIEANQKYIAGTIEYTLDESYNLNFSSIDANVFVV